LRTFSISSVAEGVRSAIDLLRKHSIGYRDGEKTLAVEERHGPGSTVKLGKARAIASDEQQLTPRIPLMARHFSVAAKRNLGLKR
jgi:hypothetical protein